MRSYILYEGPDVYVEGETSAVPREGERVIVNGARYVVESVAWSLHSRAGNLWEQNATVKLRQVSR